MERIKQYWVDLPLRAKGASVVALPILAFLLSLALSTTLRYQQVRAEAWVVHTYEVRMELQEIYTSIAEASTGVRGYLLTERDNFLRPYQKALTDLPDGLSKLKSLVGDNPDQQSRAKRVEVLINAQLAYLDRLLASAATAPAAARNVLLIESKAELDEVRQLLTRMSAEEAQLLEQRVQRERGVRNAERAALGLSALLGLIGGFAAVTLFVNAILRRLQLLSLNAARLSQGVSLQSLPGGADEIGGLGRELAKTHGLLQARSEALKRSRDELEVQNRQLEAQRHHLGRLADFRQALVELFDASLQERAGESFYAEVVSRAVAVIPGAQAGSLLLRQGDAYCFVAATGYDIEALAGVRLSEEELTLPSGTTGPYLIRDFGVTRALDPRARSVFEGAGRLDEIRATITVPITLEGLRYAVLNLDTFEGADGFGEEAMGMAAAFAGQIATILARLDLEHKLRQRNLELERANELKKEFLANTSHELRTPLTAIIGFSELLLQEAFGPLNETQTQYLRDIYDSGEHLLALINDILDLSKIEAGKMELRLEPVDTAALVKDVLALIRERAHRAGLELAVRAPQGTSYFRADGRKLKQALLNLLSNAVKFTPAGGSVTLRVTPAPDEVRFEVEDTGVGIPVDEQEKLFKEFSQIDSSLSRQHEGTGLGLALTKRLVELHGGRVWVKSEPGVGSTFGFVLPTRTEARVATEQRPDALPSEAPYLLVVEDDDRIADLLETYLRRGGYHTARARDGREALEMMYARPPVAVTLDLMMPGMAGQTFLETLAGDAQLNSTPVVIVSVIEPPQGLALGAAAVLPKPVDRSALLGALAEAIGKTAEGKVLMVVDDDPLVLGLLDEQLKRAGYTVVTARTGQEALERGEKRRPDLVILDLLMPEMSGFEVVDRLRSNEAFCDLPIIVLTSLDLGEEERRRLRGRVSAVAEKKHFDAEAFMKEVQRALPGPEAG